MRPEQTEAAELRNHAAFSLTEPTHELTPTNTEMNFILVNAVNDWKVETVKMCL